MQNKQTSICDQINLAALQHLLAEQGSDWYQQLQQNCPHLFAQAIVPISPSQQAQMVATINIIEKLVHLPSWQQLTGCGSNNSCAGVLYGYDFHLSEQGIALIEINTNAGGIFFNRLLQLSQRGPDIGPQLVAMFQQEWQQSQAEQPLRCIAIVDEQPQSQFLYPEFLLAQQLLETANIHCLIADPNQLQQQQDGLYLDGQRIDLVYNRLTDFSLQHYPSLQQAWQQHQIILTPNPQHYQQYAHKQNLTWLSDATILTDLGLSPQDIETLQQNIPQTKLINATAPESDAAEQLWQQRKQLFFKPVSGYGSKGSYLGSKLTRRVFNEILQGDYVAQQLAPPGLQTVQLDNNETQLLKYDLRCYTYRGEILLQTARLYQGQTTNLRTVGGGFALVRHNEAKFADTTAAAE